MKTVTGYRAIGGKVSKTTLMTEESDAVKLANAQAAKKGPVKPSWYFKFVMGGPKIWRVRTLSTKYGIKHYTIDEKEQFCFRHGASYETRAACKRAAVARARVETECARRNLRDNERTLKLARAL